LSAQAVPQAAEKALEKCSIAGQVVRAGTGEPLKKARVVLRKPEGRDPPYLAVTDPHGQFLIKDIEPGRYRLLVARNGYVRQEYGQKSPNRPGITLALAPGQQVRDLLFRLIPAGVITGRVYDEDGEPVAGVRVFALMYRYHEGKRQLFPVRPGTTDDRGEYRLHGLPPDRYYVSATYSEEMEWQIAGAGMESGIRSESTAPEEGYAPTYYPGTNDPARATPLELSTGAGLTGIDFILLPTRTVRLRGRVFNSITGKPGRGIMLWIVPRSSAGMFLMMDKRLRVEDPEGKFEFRSVPPGSYILSAEWYDGEKDYSSRLPIEVGGVSIDGIELLIEPGFDVPGRVHVETPPRPQAQSSDETHREGSGPSQSVGQADLGDLGIYLELRDDLPFFGRSGAGRVKGDGTFTLQNVSRGEYRVNLWRLPEDYYLKSARFGGDDVLEEGLTVSGPPKGSLDLVLSAAGGRIEGTVLDEEKKAFSGATVVLVPGARHRERRELFKTTTTDQYGRFTLRGISPGEYKLFAWQEIEPGAYQDPDFLRAYETKGHTLRITEGEGVIVELRLIPSTDPFR
jgi:hypothetical protein